MNVISFKSFWKSYVDAIDLRDRGIGYVAAGGTNVAPSATGAGSLGVTVAASTGVGFLVNSATAFTTYAGGAITLTAADATNPRVDIVYFSSAGALAKTDGTAAAIVPGVSGPVPPAWPAGSCPLAICLVPSTATDFTTGGYVMDVRCFRSLPTGTASATTFWRGDNQWAAPSTASGGTPALVLGTTNTPGAASTFIRDDDTILVFDATLPANTGALATGAATTAARRDHVHSTRAQSVGVVDTTSRTIASVSYTDIPAMTVTIVTTGGDVLIFLNMVAYLSAGSGTGQILFQVVKDGTAMTTPPHALLTPGALSNPMSFMLMIRDPAPTSASHVYKIQWRTDVGTNTANNGGYEMRLVAEELAH